MSSDHRGPHQRSHRVYGVERAHYHDESYEFARLRVSADTQVAAAATELGIRAEFGGWELARTQRFSDGTRVVLLRRHRPANVIPLPGLSR